MQMTAVTLPGLWRGKRRHHLALNQGVNWATLSSCVYISKILFPSAHLTKNLPSSILTGTSNTNTNNNTKPYFMSHIMDTHTQPMKVNNLMPFLFYFSYIFYFYGLNIPLTYQLITIFYKALQTDKCDT